MKSMIIEYDLCSPGRNYNTLYETIQSYGVWARITESTWFIKTGDSCVQVRDKLKKCMDSNDRLFVAELTGTAAWSNILCDSDYLKKHL